MDAGFTANRSPTRMALLLLGALGFVVLGAWIAGLLGEPPRTGREWLGWVAMVFFGGLTPILARRLLDRGEVLRINADGIWWRDHADVVIPWSEISAWGEMRIGRQRFITLKLRHPDLYPARGILGALAPANRAMTEADVSITLVGTDGNLADAMAAIEHHFEEST